jgi:hypothetical protein
MQESEFDDVGKIKEDASSILRPVLTLFGLFLIGLIYLFTLPLRWLPVNSLILPYSVLFIGIIGFMLLLRHGMQSISPEMLDVVTWSLIDACGLVILLFPVTPIRGYIEPGQPFGFGLGISAIAWPLFIVIGIAVFIASRGLRRPTMYKRGLVIGSLSFLGFLTIVLSWLIVPVIMEISPSHIAAICLFIIPPLNNHSRTTQIESQ